MRILLTNDDGIQSPGLLALAEVFGDIAEVTIIAPASQRSGSGHAFSYKKPITFQHQELPGGLEAVAVDGTPVDCVKMGLFWTEKPFDWVFSGINQGANLGVDAFYSGTVGGATEGAIQGVPGIAFSLDHPDEAFLDIRTAADLCRSVFDQLSAHPLGPNTCLSVNVPARPPDEIVGIWPSAQAHQRYVPTFAIEPSENGQSVLFRTDVEVLPDESEEVDFARLKGGWITVTPLTIDRTQTTLLKEMRSWTWTL